MRSASCSTADVSGPVNLTAPRPSRTRSSPGSSAGPCTVRRCSPCLAFAISAVLGEFARSSILGGQRASSAKLTGAGFSFTHTRLDQALRTALARR